MLTKLIIRNFKRFENVEIDLGRAVVFIGPNNSGKTTALQALALWEIGVRRWNERRGADSVATKRTGVAINRKEIFAVAVPNARLLWRDLKAKPRDVLIDIEVEGVTDGVPWRCGLEFDYANEESLYCRPLRVSNGEGKASRMPVPESAANVRVAFLPPMSGLEDREFSKQPGEINFLIGLGQTARVLRNLCARLARDAEHPERWKAVVKHMQRLFLVEFNDPVLTENDEIIVSYSDPRKVVLDLASAGRGLQQTLLLLCYLFANPGTVLLLDEPDAHLELLRQQQIYSVLTEIAAEQGSQIVAASHSEKVLEAAADRDVVVAFIYDRVKRLDDRGLPAKKHLLKSLQEVGFSDFYQAQLCRWVLYVEGSTDLSILRAFARLLGHDGATLALDKPFVLAVGNDMKRAKSHFDTLRSVQPDLRGIAVLDRRDDDPGLPEGMTATYWRRREIENYLNPPHTLAAYALGDSTDDLFGQAEAQKRADLMLELVKARTPPAALLDAADPFWRNTKISDEYFDVILAEYFKRLGLPNLFRKTDYHSLAHFLRPTDIDPEIREKLDAIAAAAAVQ